MSDEQLPDPSEVRARMIQRFWTLLDADPTTEATIVRPDEPMDVDIYNDCLGVAESDEDENPYANLELGNYTLENRTVAAFVYDRAVLAGESRTVAYDLGDDWWYVVTELDDEEPQLIGAVRSPDVEPFFDEVRVNWIEDVIGGVLGLGSLTGIDGYDLTATPTARLLVDAAMRELSGSGGGEALQQATCSRFMLGQEPGSEIQDEARRIYLERSWAAIAIADPPTGDSVPPDLTRLIVDSGDFDAWLNGVVLRWRDTSEPIDPQTARQLRVVLQYLAAACTNTD